MRLLGPVFWYDLVRIARRQRLALWRAAYGLALLIALYLQYTHYLPLALLDGVTTNPAYAAAFANRVFADFTVLQFAAVILLTPPLTANGLAEERSRNTLTFLLTTHLSSREIVLSKLCTRLLQVGLLVLTGLPVFAMLQFMGGVEPMLLLASFAALALTGLSLGSLGIACAVFVKKPQNAAWLAYQIVFVYAALSLISIWYWELPFNSKVMPAPAGLIVVPPPLLPPPPPPPPAPPLPPPLTTAQRLLEGFNSVNPYFAFLRLKYEQEAGRLLPDILPAVLRDYAIGHGAFTLLLLGWAVLRLRTVTAKQSTGLTHKKALLLRAAPHPPIGNRPVLWKEIYCEARPRQRWLALFFSRWLFFASFLLALVSLVLVAEYNVHLLDDYLITALRYGGTLVAVVLCLRVALHAARSIGQERDRQTLDSLLTTELTPGEIIRDKWWGSFLTGRWLLLWLTVHWCLGMVPFTLNPVALPLLLLECLVYGAFFASLGMYCAVRFRTTRQAVVVALVVGLLGTSLLPWAGGKILTAVLPAEMERANNSRLILAPSSSYIYIPDVSLSWPETLAIGLTPAWVLFESVLSNHSDMLEYYWKPQARIDKLFPCILFGLAAYLLAALVLGWLAVAQFRRSVRGQPPVAQPSPLSRQRPAVSPP